MRHVLALWKRELISYFLSPVGYIVGSVFILLYNWFFFFGFKEANDANMALAGGISAVMFLVTFAIPFLTMGLLADEKRTGTIEMLMTAPVADWEVVLGKYLGALLFIVVLSLPSLLHVVAVRAYVKPDWGPIISGYIGLGLVILLLVSMGLFFSSVSKSALVAVMISFVAFMTLLILGIVIPETAPAIKTSNVFTNILHYVFKALRYASLGEHYNNFAYGLVNTKDLAYFLSGTAFFLFLSTLAVESRKWK